MDATADILLYGNAERAVVEIAQRLAQGELVSAITDVRGTAFVRRDTPEGWFEIDSTRIDRPGKIDKIINPYVNTQDTAACAIEQEKGAQEDPQEAKVVQLLANPRLTREKTVIRLPSFEKVRNDPVLYAHANRVLHLETNPGNARALSAEARRSGCLVQPAAHSDEHREWTTCSACPMPACRTRPTARRRFPPTR
ncbi:hypothetical protein ACPA9J_05000 [Pseudomonas aeruginosa]